VSGRGLAAALAPRSVAVVGASSDPDRIGGRPVHYLQLHGFRGAVYPINPNRREVQGLPAYPALADLPEAPDAVVVAVPGEAAVETVGAAAALGAQVAVVMASGFGETGAAGRALEQSLVASARAGGMRVVGPNAQGLANFGSGAILSFSTMFVEYEPQDGPVAVVSQSGSMSAVPYALLRRQGIGVRHAHSTGNDADVTAAELAALVAEDEAVRLLLLYLEKVDDAAALARIGRIARERDLPVVALKAGATPPGRRAAESHTGALATEDAVVDAFLERHGIWRARTTRELVHAAELYLQRPRVAGRRLAVVSNSGASCVMAADAAHELGLPLAELLPATREQLAAILPPFASVQNPVDVTAALLNNSRLLSEVLPVLSADPTADSLLVAIPIAGRGYDLDAFAADSADALRTSGKPLLAAIPQPPLVQRFRSAGVPVFETEAEALAALAQYVAHDERRRHATRAGRYEAPGASGAPAELLSEAESLQLLGRAGLPVVPHRVCRDLASALAAAGELGYPVVLKASTTEVVHRSDAGLVRLDLADADALRAAYDELAQPEVLVAAQVRGRHELMLGGRVDRVFGPVVVLGAGGAYVETLPDAAVLLWPFDEEDVRRVLSRLRIAPLLAGVRNEPPVATDAIARAAVSGGRLLADEHGRVVSFDVNPIVVGPATCIAVDAAVFRVQ
jgi:acyl-CoA synthetase (NDP forming)